MKSSRHTTSKRSHFAFVGVGLCLLVLVLLSQKYIDGQLGQQSAAITNERMFADPQLGFILRVPQEWSQPLTLKHATVTEVRFDHKLTIFMGQHYSDLAGRNLTFDDIAQHMFPNAMVEDIMVNGQPAKKIYRGTSGKEGTDGYVIVARQPHKSPEDVVMIYVENDRMASSVASSFSFIRT